MRCFLRVAIDPAPLLYKHRRWSFFALYSLQTCFNPYTVRIMKKYLYLLSLIIILPLLSGCHEKAERTEHIETIVFIRHAEKSKDGLGQLSCAGLNRALALPAVLTKKFGDPNYILAANPNSVISENKGLYYYVRPLATIEPTAIQLKMPVKTLHSYDDDFTMAQTLINPEYRNATVYVAWEHRHLADLVRNIMVLTQANPNLIPNWQREDFDSIYVLKLNWKTHPPQVTFTRDKQNLNNLSSMCATTINQKIVQPKQTTTFLFIPEGEEPANGLGQLNCRGLNRALDLQWFLNKRIGKIDYFFAPSTSDSMIEEGEKLYYLVRPLMTIEPTAISQNAPVSTPFGYKDVERMAAHLNSRVYDNKTIAVVWPREGMRSLINIVYGMYAGQSNQIPKNLPQRDTIYKMTITRANNTVTPSFTIIQEKLPKLSSICPQAVMK